MSEFYEAVFSEFQKRLNENMNDLFPFMPLNFIQVRQLAMMAATIAEEVRDVQEALEGGE